MLKEAALHMTRWSPEYIRGYRRLTAANCVRNRRRSAVTKRCDIMADVIVRQASLDDVEDIYRIEKLCFPDPWSRDALNYELGENRESILYRGRAGR